MDNIWHCGVIRYLQKKRIRPHKEIHLDMVATLGNDAPALSTVKSAAEFKGGRESLEDDPRSGHPSMATTQENIDCIHKIVMDDRHLTVNHIANAISISRE